MPSAPEKPKSPSPFGFLRSIGFGLMLAAWWISTAEIPARNLFMLIVEGRSINQNFAPITLWAHSLTQAMIAHRIYGLVGIVLLTIIHLILRLNLHKWDAYGKWLYKAGFMLLYIILYGTFILVFIGAELPIWTAGYQQG